MKNKILGKDLIVNINWVKPNTWNPKESIEENEENKERFEEIKNEIDKKGLFEAITVRELEKDNFEILDGFHRWKACNELGFEEIRINNLGTINDKLARAITVIKEQKKVPVSELKVADVIGEMSKMGISFEEMQDLFGYSEDKLNEYLKMFAFDWEQFEAKFEESDQESKELSKEKNDKKVIIIRLKKETFNKVSNSDIKDVVNLLDKLNEV